MTSQKDEGFSNTDQSTGCSYTCLWQIIRERSASFTRCEGRWSMVCPHKAPVRRKVFSCHDAAMWGFVVKQAPNATKHYPSYWWRDLYAYLHNLVTVSKCLLKRYCVYLANKGIVLRLGIAQQTSWCLEGAGMCCVLQSIWKWLTCRQYSWLPWCCSYSKTIWTSKYIII